MTTIKHMYIIALSFPVAHYISGWRPIIKTYHLVTFLITDSGVIGVGEGTPYGSSIAETYARTLYLAKTIRGLSLEEALKTLVSKEYGEFEKNRRVDYGAYLALELAILHALSQYRKMRYEAEVLGGVHRTSVPITYTIFLNHPKTMARRLRNAIESGFKHVKFKIPCSLEELEELLKTMSSAVKQHNVEDLVLRADANEYFSTLEKARKALLIMERYDVKIVEQPMPKVKLKDIAKLRRVPSNHRDHA